MSQTKIERKIEKLGTTFKSSFEKLKDSLEKSSKTQKWLVIFTAIMAFAIILQVVIMYNQTVIIKESSRPNYPDLKIDISYYSQSVSGNLYIHKEEICYPDNIDAFRLYFQNRGNQDSGLINFFLVSYGLEFIDYVYNQSEVYRIENIPPGESEFVDIVFRGSENFCQEETQKKNIWVAVDFSCALCNEKNQVKSFNFEVN